MSFPPRVTERHGSAASASSAGCDHGSSLGEAGVVLITSLVVLVLLSALILAATATATFELRESLLRRERDVVRDAASTALHVTANALASAGSWSAVLLGGETSAYFGASRVALNADQSLVVDLTARGSRLQRRSDARGNFGANQPTWQRYLGAHLSEVAGEALGRRDVLLAAWVADDTGESDGDARVDTNGVVLVQVEAYGAAGVRGSLRAALERQPGWPSVRTLWLAPGF